MGTEPRRARLSVVLAWTSQVRVRITLAAVLVVGIALFVGATVLVVALRELLTEEVANGARVQSAEVAAAAASGAPLNRLLVDDLEDEVVQLVDHVGGVLASSRNVTGMPVIARPGPDEYVEIDGPVGSFPLVAVATEVRTPRGVLTAVVARSLEPVAESEELVVGLLLIGAPILLLVIALTTWILVGRALAPVEAIRHEVDEISASELHRRVPGPAVDDEIGRLALTMNRMLDRVESGHRRQQRFVSDASHELRTPVTVIRQHAEITLAHPERFTASELAETVLVEDLRIQRMIEDLLLLARSDEFNLQLNRQPVDLDDIVFAAARRLRSATELRIDTSAVSAGQIEGDDRAMQRVLRNLCENAARHARSKIVFVLGELDGHVDLTVDDDGPGIPQEDRQRVLERFVRLDVGRARESGGSGLGLSIVAELVGAHGGSLEVAEAPAGGTRVHLRFPCPQQG